MALIHDHAQQPPGGHHFTDPTGVLLRGKTIRALLSAIALYRLNNHLPGGNPAREVEDAYRVLYPWLVEGEPEPVTKDEAIDLWLGRVWRNPPKEWAEEVKTVKRLKTCEGCEKYEPEWRPEGNRLTRLIILSGGRYLADAGYCRHHGWACGLSTLVEYAETTSYAFPGCWNVK